MLKLLILLLVLYIAACAIRLFWTIGRKLAVAGACLFLAGVLFPNPVAGLLLLGLGVAFLLV